MSSRAAVPAPDTPSGGNNWRGEPGVKFPGVSRTVVSCDGTGHRRIFVDVDGFRCAAEQIVARRAHQAGWKAFRLPSDLWRRLNQMRVIRPEIGEGFDAFAARVSPAVPTIQAGDRESKGRPWAFAAVLVALGDDRLAAMKARHQGDVDPRHPGVPDLIAFKFTSGRASHLRFIEVKGLRERLMPHQRAELIFMRGKLKLKAGVFRLDERARYPSVRRRE